MKKIALILIVSLFAASSALATDAWDINQNFVKLGAVDAAWTIDAFFEKRSFNFGDAKLPDLYTKSRRIGGEIGFQF